MIIKIIQWNNILGIDIILKINTYTCTGEPKDMYMFNSTALHLQVCII